MVFQVRKDVHVKHPTNKGINKNFPEAADLRINSEVIFFRTVANRSIVYLFNCVLNARYPYSLSNKAVDSGGSLAARERVDVHRKCGGASRQNPVYACVATSVADRGVLG